MANDIARVTLLFQKLNKPLADTISNSIAKLPTPDFNELVSKLGCCNGNLPKMYMYVTTYWFKSMEWMPSLAEVVIFTTFIAIIFIIYEIWQSNQINTRVKNESRCARKVNAASDTVTAIDDKGNPLYTVTYDMVKRDYSIKCEGDRNGNINNQYNVKLYDFNKKQAKNDKKQKCNQTFTATSGMDNTDGLVYYSGDPGLVNFMQFGDTTHFTT
jgi:hypothetical protein